MSEQDERQRRIVKGEHDEPKDDVEGHGFRAEQTEPKQDDDSDEVEAHHHGGRGKA